MACCYFLVGLCKKWAAYAYILTQRDCPMSLHLLMSDLFSVHWKVYILRVYTFWSCWIVWMRQSDFVVIVIICVGANGTPPTKTNCILLEPSIPTSFPGSFIRPPQRERGRWKTLGTRLVITIMDDSTFRLLTLTLKAWDFFLGQNEIRLKKAIWETKSRCPN